MSQQEDQGGYRKRLVREIRRHKLEPRADIPQEGELEGHVYVVGQLIGKLRAYGVSDELIARLDKVRWNPDRLEDSVSDADARLIAHREVDETFYRIERAIRQIDALASQEPPLSREERAKDRKDMETMQTEDGKRAELMKHMRQQREKDMNTHER